MKRTSSSISRGELIIMIGYLRGLLFPPTDRRSKREILEWTAFDMSDIDRIRVKKADEVYDAKVNRGEHP